MSAIEVDHLASPSDLEAEALFAMMDDEAKSTWAPSSDAVLKLHLEGGRIRRVRVDQLSNGTGGPLSFKRLLHLAVRYSPGFGDKYDSFIDWEVNWAEFSKKWQMEIIYKHRGRWLRISSDRDLVAAFERAARAPTVESTHWASPPKAILPIDEPIVLPCIVMVKDCRKKGMRRSASNSSLNSKKAKKGTASRQRRAKRAMRWSPPPKGSVNYHKQLRDLVRQLVTLISTAAVVLGAKLEDATREEARKMYRSKAKKLIQELLEEAERSKGIAGTPIGSDDDDVEEEVPDITEAKVVVGDPNFVHGRHGCDGCGVQPIVGLRYHAVTMDDFDFCAGCMSKYTGDRQKFEVEQLACDVPFQHKEIDFDACEFEEANDEEEEAVADAPVVPSVTEEEQMLQSAVSIQQQAVVVEDVTDDEDEEIDAASTMSTSVVEVTQSNDNDETSVSSEGEEEQGDVDVAEATATKVEREVKPSQSAPKINKASMEAIAQFEKAIYMMGNALDKVIEGGSNVAEKSKDSVAAITVATTAMLAAAAEKEEPKPAPKAKMQRIAESKQNAQMFARAAFSQKAAPRRPSPKPSNLISKVGSTFALITQPVVQALKEQVEAAEAMKQGSPRTTRQVRRTQAPKAKANDAYDKGHISDKDFDQFLKWWSPTEKTVVASKEDELSCDNNGHLDDESFNNFMNTWSTSSRPDKKAIVQDFCNSTSNDGQLSDADFEKFMSNWPAVPTTPPATKKRSRRSDASVSNGELSDEDFEKFLSAWSTTPTKKAKAPNSMDEEAMFSDGTLSDQEFRQFLGWWSTSGPSAHVREACSQTSSDQSIALDTSVSVTSVDISASSSAKSNGDGGVEVQLEDGIIVLGAQSEDNDMWNFVENSSVNEDLNNAAAMLGSSLYEQDLAASAEAGSATSKNTVIISNASDDTVVISCDGCESFSLSSSASCLDASIESDDGFSFVDSDDSDSSASIISFESEM